MDDKTLKKTGTFIGRKGNIGFRYWEPSIGQYVKFADPKGKFEWLNSRARRAGAPHLDLCWYINRYGHHVRGVRPAEGLHSETVIDSRTGNKTGEYIMTSSVGYRENPKYINDPRNITGVPRKILNPNYREEPEDAIK